MFADARGAGGLGLPTSAIFESVRRQNQAFLSLFFPQSLFSFFLYILQQDEIFSEGVFSQYVSSHHISLVDLYYETNTINNRSSGKYSRLS